MRLILSPVTWKRQKADGQRSPMPTCGAMKNTACQRLLRSHAHPLIPNSVPGKTVNTPDEPDGRG